MEWLDLSHNEFVAMPSSALSEIAPVLRELDLSDNRIEHVDGTMFAAVPGLVSLSLNNNRLTILPDNVFSGLSSSLHHLDLSSNNLVKTSLRDLLHHVQGLRTLNLARAGLEEVPASMPLPHLAELDLSGNSLSDVPYEAITRLAQLRSLNVSSNRLVHLPAHCWPHLPHLKILDISHNPTR